MEEIKILLDKLGLMGIKMHLTEVMESVDESCISGVREVLEPVFMVNPTCSKAA